MSKISAFLFFWLGTGLATAAWADAGIYLFKIPTTGPEDEKRTLSGTVFADLYVSAPERVAQALVQNSGLRVFSSTEGVVRVAIEEGQTLSGEPTADHLAASFVVDFDEPAVTSLLNEFPPGEDARSVEVLVQFVHEAITDKTYGRGFDVASQVASSRAGDCTEHAVLLAALARALNMPARVAVGLLLVEHEGVLQSLGHAWTEIYDGERWLIADATLVQEQLPGATTRYVPLLELTNEGPGYAMNLGELALYQPSRVEVIR